MLYLFTLIVMSTMEQLKKQLIKCLLSALFHVTVSVWVTSFYLGAVLEDYIYSSNILCTGCSNDVMVLLYFNGIGHVSQSRRIDSIASWWVREYQYEPSTGPAK